MSDERCPRGARGCNWQVDQIVQLLRAELVIVDLSPNAGARPYVQTTVRSMSDSISLYQNYRVDAQFVNRGLAAQAFGLDPDLHMSAIADIVVAEVIRRRIEDLRIASASSTLNDLVSHLVMVRGGFYFRKQRSKSRQSIRFHRKLNVDENYVLSVEGEFDPSRLETSSARTNLSGQAHVTIVGYAREIDPGQPYVEIRPILIGFPFFATGADRDPVFSDKRAELQCSNIDEFGLQNYPSLDVEERDLLRLFRIPESKIKAAFGSILGLSNVPNDWGGENSDLVADLTIRGYQARAAFAFKGPGGKRKPWMLHPGGMGKNGDQAIRLFSEHADLMVVQHCSDVASSVRHLMEALATKHGKRYMIIDGRNTVRILHATGMFT